MIRNKAGKDIALKAVRPNAGIRAAYHNKLVALVDDMARSYAYWLRARYREYPPRLARDASPAAELERELKTLGSRWQKNFDEAAPKLARWFALSSAARSDAALRKILKDAGFTIKLTIAPSIRDVLDATINENVALIKSIPSHFHTQVSGSVMRSVTAGRDLSDLTKDLQHQFGVTRRRAEFIALDQNNKATAMLQRARHLELGITGAIWLHSGGGKEPRKTHKAQNGKKFDLKEGWFDPDPKVRQFIFPGELPRCRCVARPVVKGFS
ncbi:MAG: phage minor head protein [Vulcanimicrobiaceae bacterium]